MGVLPQLNQPYIIRESAASGRRFRLSKLLFESGLFKYSIGRVPRFDLAIDRNMPSSFGAVPDFVITLASRTK
jgi:hypothetical protein